MLLDYTEMKKGGGGQRMHAKKVIGKLNLENFAG